MPYAFAESGYLGATCILLLVTSLTYYCCTLLLDCKKKHSSVLSPLDTYGKVGGLIMGNWIVLWIDGLVVFTQVGFCVSYSIFMASTFLRLFDGLEIWFAYIIVGMIVIPLVMIRDISYLAWTSAISSLLLLMGMVGCTSAFEFHWENLNAPMVQWERILIVFGMCTASFEGIGLVIPVEESFETKFDNNPYLPILKISIIVAASILILFGFGGFLTYGEGANAVMTLNLPSGSTLSALVGYCFCTAIYFSYPLQLFPAVVTIEKHSATLFGSHPTFKKYLYPYGILVRLFLIYLTITIGYYVPWYGLISAVVGSLGSASLTYILPPLFHYIDHKNDQQWQIKTVLDILLVIFGSTVAVIGTLFSVGEIISSM